MTATASSSVCEKTRPPERVGMFVYETDWIKLGFDQYVWFAPTVKDPKAAKAVYIDYVSMEREE